MGLLVGSVRRASTLDLRVMSMNPTLGEEITKNNNNNKNNNNKRKHRGQDKKLSNNVVSAGDYI